MAVLVICKTDDDTIKIEALVCPQHFLHYMSMGKAFSELKDK